MSTDTLCANYPDHFESIRNFDPHRAPLGDMSPAGTWGHMNRQWFFLNTTDRRDLQTEKQESPRQLFPAMPSLKRMFGPVDVENSIGNLLQVMLDRGQWINGFTPADVGVNKADLEQLWAAGWLNVADGKYWLTCGLIKLLLTCRVS